MKQKTVNNSLERVFYGEQKNFVLYVQVVYIQINAILNLIAIQIQDSVTNTL